MASKQALGLLMGPQSPNVCTFSPLSMLGGVRCYRTYTDRNIPTRLSQAERKAMDEMNEQARAMERNFTRDWQPGDVYAPHDLSAAEARKWRQRKAPTTDAFDVLSLNPLDLYKNFAVMSEYVTDMGRIRPRSQTGLRPVNQRRLAKAIRRAIASGLMPAVHRHPEILRIEKKNNPSTAV